MIGQRDQVQCWILQNVNTIVGHMNKYVQIYDCLSEVTKYVDNIYIYIYIVIVELLKFLKFQVTSRMAQVGCRSRSCLPLSLDAMNSVRFRNACRAT